MEEVSGSHQGGNEKQECGVLGGLSTLYTRTAGLSEAVVFEIPQKKGLQTVQRPRGRNEFRE